MPAARGVAWARFRVTVLVIAALSILSVLVYLLTGGRVLQRQTTLYLFIPDATGLDLESPVRVNGTDVGKVRKVEFSGSAEPTRVVRLTLAVEPERVADISVDSTAQISTAGVLGDKYVDISQGVNPARIAPQGEIQFKASPELLKTLDVQQFVEQLRTVDATLADIENGRSEFGQFVLGDRMYRDLQKGLADLDRGFRDATSTTSTLGQALSTDRQYQLIRTPLMRIDDELARVQAGQGPYGRLLREDGQYQHFREQAADLHKSIADLRKQEFLASDQMYTAWSRSLATWITRVDQFNSSPMFTSSATYDNLSGMARDLSHTLRDFREDPRKYLRLVF